MTPLSDIKDRLTGAAREQGAEYGRQDGQPLSDYARIMGVYGLLVGGIAGAVRVSGRPVPDRPSLADVALFAAATHKLSVLLTRDPVTSPLRAPFTRFEGASGRPRWQRLRVAGAAGRPWASW